MASIFSKIIAGEIPGSFIFQDEHWVGLLDLFPVSPGHLLLVPTVEVPLFGDLPAPVSSAYGATLSTACRAMYAALGCDAVSVLIRDGAAAGQEIPHVHVHLVPRWQGDKPHHFAGGSYGADDEAVKAAMAAMQVKLSRAWATV